MTSSLLQVHLKPPSGSSLVILSTAPTWQILIQLNEGLAAKCDEQNQLESSRNDNLKTHSRESALECRTYLSILLNGKLVFLKPKVEPRELLLFQVRGVEAFQSPSSFVLSDGTSLEADAILFCTGYSFEFGFLHPDCRVSVVNNQVPIF